MLSSIDARFDQRGLNLINRLRPKVYSSRNLFHRMRGDQFRVGAHRDNHFVLVRRDSLLFAASRLDARRQQFNLATAGTISLSFVKQLAGFPRKTLRSNEPEANLLKPTIARQSSQAITPLFSQFPAGLEFRFNLCREPDYFVFLRVVCGFKAVCYCTAFPVARNRGPVSRAAGSMNYLWQSDQIGFRIQLVVD